MRNSYNDYDYDLDVEETNYDYENPLDQFFDKYYDESDETNEDEED